MVAPLCDSRGKIRYHIGAQVDVSGLVKDCTDLESLQRLVDRDLNRRNGEVVDNQQENADEFQELSEMLNMGELETVRRWGGRMHREYQEEDTDSSRNGAQHRPRLLLKEPTADASPTYSSGNRGSGRLGGIYNNVESSLFIQANQTLIRRSIYSSGPTHPCGSFSLPRVYVYLVFFSRHS